VGYRFLEDIAIADVAFQVWGETLEMVFQDAARATMSVMVADLQSIADCQTRQVELQATSLDLLLFDFLQEVVYYKDAERLLLLPAKVEIAEQGTGWSVRSTFSGEEVDARRHPLLVDVKAVTMHRFALHRSDSGWQAEVVLDI